MILAGEASGDTHGARVATELRRRWPRAEMVGLGGAQMANAGVKLLCGLRELSAMGLVEVLGRLGFHWRLERRLRSMLRHGDFDVVVPVDYPGLNLRMARYAWRLDVPVLYYIGPQVWAWKAWRAKRLARWARSIAVILPFEPALYSAHGGRATFVGHPLLDHSSRGDPEALCRELGLDRDGPVLGIFPGSREPELARHGRPFANAAMELRRRIQGLQVVVSKVPFLSASAYGSLPFPATEDGPALRALATAGLVKSGTSTLEAALAGMPFVVAYVTHPLTHFLARRMVRVPSIALANLVVGRRVVPEFIQREVTPESVADALEPLLDGSSPARNRALADLADVRRALGTPGAATRVVDMIGEILSEEADGRRGPSGRHTG